MCEKRFDFPCINGLKPASQYCSDHYDHHEREGKFAEMPSLSLLLTWTSARVMGLEPFRRQRAIHALSNSQNATHADFDLSDLEYPCKTFQAIITNFTATIFTTKKFVVFTKTKATTKYLPFIWQNTSHSIDKCSTEWAYILSFCTIFDVPNCHRLYILKLRDSRWVMIRSIFWLCLKTDSIFRILNQKYWLNMIGMALWRRVYV